MVMNAQEEEEEEGEDAEDCEEAEEEVKVYFEIMNELPILGSTFHWSKVVGAAVAVALVEEKFISKK